jgi:hypothetical protein
MLMPLEWPPDNLSSNAEVLADIEAVSLQGHCHKYVA